MNQMDALEKFKQKLANELQRVKYEAKQEIIR